MSRQVFYIGCAGWSIPREHAPLFPAAGTHLQRYAAVFNAVEINSSFYRPHRRETYERWADSVPPSFRFSVKCPKEITHTLRLRRGARPLDAFFDQVEGLGRRLGPVLVQLPPSLTFERLVVKRFAERVRDRFEGAVVIEPRHPSWFASRVDALLHAHHISRVAADPALSEMAALPGGDPSSVYFRLHGSPRMYYSDYSPGFIATVARRMRASGGSAWCIFDNTANGAAPSNARALAKQLRVAIKPSGMAGGLG